MIIPFLNKVENYLQINPQALTVKILRTVHLRTKMDKEKAILRSRELHNGEPAKKHVSKKKGNGREGR